MNGAAADTADRIVTGSAPILIGCATWVAIIGRVRAMLVLAGHPPFLNAPGRHLDVTTSARGLPLQRTVQ